MNSIPLLTILACLGTLISCQQEQRAPEQSSTKANPETANRHLASEPHQAEDPRSHQRWDTSEKETKTNGNTELTQFPPDYREQLSQYGAWRNDSTWGEVWQPEAARNPAWKPYQSGRWTAQGDDWLWESEEPFGDLVYHFGRWHLDSRHGWIWIPSDQWAPSWVIWSQSDSGHIGWAPLPPESLAWESVGACESFQFIDNGIHHFTFVEDTRIFQPVHNFILPIEHSRQLCRKARQIGRWQRYHGKLRDHGPIHSDARSRDPSSRDDRLPQASRNQTVNREALERARNRSGKSVVRREAIVRRQAGVRPGRTRADELQTQEKQDAKTKQIHSQSGRTAQRQERATSRIRRKSPRDAEKLNRARDEKLARERAAKIRRQKEQARKRAEEAARKKAREEARKRAEEAARERADKIRRQKEQARKRAEEAARKKAREEARKRAEKAARERADKIRRQKEQARKRAEEAARKKAREEARKRAEEAARKRAK